MKLFNLPIRTIKWWERLLLPFAPKFLTADIGKDKTVYCLSKKLFGKLYFIKFWEEETKVSGIKYNYIYFDDVRPSL